MSLIGNCLVKLVRSGQITENAARSALALYETPLRMIDVPAEWFLCFKSHSKSPLVNLIPGRFKHVTAFARLTSLDAWVFVEFAWRGGSVVAVVKDDQADKMLARFARDAVVLKVKTGQAKQPWPGMWCVPLIKSCVLRADGLFRDCLRQGAEIVIGDLR